MENTILNIKMTNAYPESSDMTIFGKTHAKRWSIFHLCCHNFWNTCPKSIKIVYLDSCNHELSQNISFTWFLRGPKVDLMTSLWRHLPNLHKFYYIFKKIIRSYLSMPISNPYLLKWLIYAGRVESAPHVCVIQNGVKFSVKLLEFLC